MDAGFLWRRLPEADFPVKPRPAATSQRAPALNFEQDTEAALAAAGGGLSSTPVATSEDA